MLQNGNQYRILWVEDEIKSGQFILDELIRNGYKTDMAIEGPEARKMFAEYHYSLVLLNSNLPNGNGFLLCREFRELNKKIPIIILSAVGEIEDKMLAFNSGADDYLVKPFHFVELFARIKVFLKRSEVSSESEIITLGNMTIDFLNKTVVRNGVNINLTAKEFTLLVLLARNTNRIVSKQEILEKVWDMHFTTGTNSIEVYISFLRNKIDKPFDHKLIYTKPGFGYYIK